MKNPGLGHEGEVHTTKNVCDRERFGGMCLCELAVCVCVCARARECVSGQPTAQAHARVRRLHGPHRLLVGHAGHDVGAVVAARHAAASADHRGELADGALHTVRLSFPILRSEECVEVTLRETP